MQTRHSRAKFLGCLLAAWGDEIMTSSQVWDAVAVFQDEPSLGEAFACLAVQGSAPDRIGHANMVGPESA